MQRFKDFTKKSGKVASAILSAAMVTSMVAGTNVVYAAEANTQTEDVQTTSTQQEKNKELALKVAAAYKATAQDFPVNVATVTTEDAFKDLKDFYEEHYDVDIAITNDEIKTVPTSVKGGERVIAVTVTAGALSDKPYAKTTDISYKLASLTDRTNAAKALIEARFDKYVANNKATTSGALDEATKAYKDLTDKGIKLYSDIDVEITSATVTNSTAEDDGLVQIIGNVYASDGTNTKAMPAVLDYRKTTDNATKRVNNATEAVKNYLADCNLLDENYETSKLESAISNYLDKNGYKDVLINKKTDTTTPAAVTAKIEEDPTDFSNGTGKATFQLTAIDKDDKGIVCGDKVEQNVTLLSRQAKVDKAAKELQTIINNIEVTESDDLDSYADKFEKALSNAYLPTYATTDGSLDKVEVTTGTTVALTIDDDDFIKIYPDTKATATFSDKDANASTDGVKKVVVTVQNKQDSSIVATAEKEYTFNSAVTNADQAKAAAEAALADLTITNDTTDKEVQDIVLEAIKPYNVSLNDFTFDKTDATATKEGKATISFKVVSYADNNVYATSKVEKNFTVRSNCFVEENGKTYYYDKEGKLGTADKGYFLQGTDSPDGYTYFVQNDGSIYQDRLTYHPDGEHVIYFDKDGHEVFDAFVNVKADALGNPVDYIGYFDTFGYAYVNQTTYGNGEGAYAKDALFYINDYGVLENKGWFGNAAGEIGYAAPNGTLTTSQWSLDQFGRKVYFQANGFLAKGLMTDGVNYYQLDETDGHLVGEF